MTPNVFILAEHIDGQGHLFGWWLGFGIAIVVIVAVVVLVQAILQLAARIGGQAWAIDEALRRSEGNTAPLRDLQQTIDHAEVIVDGLHRTRRTLGG